MAYELTKSDGTTLTILENGTIDNVSSSLTFVGKNVVNYGELQNENFLKLLENFAYSTQPANKIRGQLWFDTANDTLKVYNDVVWKPVATLSYSSTSTMATGLGSLWYNSTDKQLLINNGSGYEVIGPENTAGAAITRFKSETIRDTSGNNKSVIKCYIENQVIAILSTQTFSINAGDAVNGFDNLKAGITWKDAPSSTFQSYGYHFVSENANKLLDRAGTSYVIADTTATNNTIVQRAADGSVYGTTVYSNYLQSIGSSIIVNSSLRTGNVSPSSDGSYFLGSETRKWSYVYGNNFIGISGDFNSLVVNNQYANTLTFAVLADNSNVSVSNIDKDLSTATVHSSLATSLAIKNYIDQQVNAAVNARIAAENTLSNRIDALGYPIPVGTVMYSASVLGVPAGWLECRGQLLDKQQYENLFLALGPDTSVNQYQFRNLDLRGEFLRCLDDGRGVDPYRVIGTFQNSANLEHGHLFDDIRYSEIWSSIFSYDDPMLGTISVGPGPGSNRGVDYDNGVYFLQHGTYKSGTNESRPRNVALRAIIKY